MEAIETLNKVYDYDGKPSLTFPKIKAFIDATVSGLSNIFPNSNQLLSTTNQINRLKADFENSVLVIGTDEILQKNNKLKDKSHAPSSAYIPDTEKNVKNNKKSKSKSKAKEIIKIFNFSDEQKPLVDYAERCMQNYKNNIHMEQALVIVHAGPGGLFNIPPSIVNLFIL
jgi:hypothetical protein